MAEPGGGGRRIEVGRAGEAAARELLEARGLEIVDANWRCRAGEIDLVALGPGRVLRFVEVRTRTGRGFGTGAESVTAVKRARLRRLAVEWLSAHRSAGWVRIAFDVVSVDLADPASPRLELIEEAF